MVILVADDETMIRNMVTAILEGDGYEVLSANEGMEALKLSRRYDGHIDLLISDVQMPEMNGVELATHIREERPATKVLLVSGTPDLQIPPEFRLLRKPFTATSLRETMLELVSAQHG